MGGAALDQQRGRVLLTAGTQLVLWREPLRRCQAPPHSSGGIVKGRALLLLLLASCGVDEDFSQPLTALQVRSRIVGHSIRATDSSGASYGIYFRRTDFAEIYDDTVEYVRWYADDAHGLCLQLRDEPERCAPLADGKFEVGAQFLREPAGTGPVNRTRLAP